MGHYGGNAVLLLTFHTETTKHIKKSRKPSNSRVAAMHWCRPDHYKNKSTKLKRDGLAIWQDLKGSLRPSFMEHHSGIRDELDNKGNEQATSLSWQRGTVPKAQACNGWEKWSQLMMILMLSVVQCFTARPGYRTSKWVSECIHLFVCTKSVFFVVILVRYKAIYKSDHKQSISQWTAYLKLQDNVQQWI